jgi:DNA polymerase-3 subunit delta'
MTVWERLVGQDAAVRVLRDAAVAARALVAGAPAGPATAAMAPAWLITGPPGSGRSTAALALAAALECESPGEPGCSDCSGCRTVWAGSSPDVLVLRPEGTSIAIKDVRGLVLEAARAPVDGSWRVVVVEDADRLVRGTNDRNANVLLKSIEEPPARTVFLLCAPSPVDVPATIRSRCRPLPLLTPAAAAVAALLTREGVDPELASLSAAAAQGHIGRARRLARDEGARTRRAEVLRLPSRLGTAAGCLSAAADLVSAAEEEAEATTRERDAAERADLDRALGLESGAANRRGAAGRAAGAAVRELERTQKQRGTRAQRDALDRALVDLAGLYRDVLLAQLAPGTAEATHPDLAETVRRVATSDVPERTLQRLEAVLETRQQLLDTPGLQAQLAVEALALRLA